jgi:antitoxin component YwqK of YwqJK toxin-antitoxin module
MLDKKNYTNGQKVQELKDNRLTYFFKNGKVKAEGFFENNLMEDEWIFYRETGQLWQIGNYKRGKKNGSWVRYDKNNNVEYKEHFENGVIVKNKKL